MSERELAGETTGSLAGNTTAETRGSARFVSAVLIRESFAARPYF